MKLEFDPALTTSLTALLSILGIYYGIKIVDMAAHLFVVLRTWFKRDEDIKILQQILDAAKQDQPKE